MKTPWSLVLLMASLLAACSSHPSNTKAYSSEQLEVIRQIDSLVQDLVANKHTAAISLGIQFGEGEPHYASYGHTRMDSLTKAHNETAYNIASVTKPFTATAIMKLVSEGKIALEDKLSSFFPDFPKGDSITLYQLLSHTSGIPDWWVGGLPEDVGDDWTIEPEPHKALERMKQTSLFSPGSRYSYSNAGFLLLGEIIERVSGKAYEAFLKEQIFEPLEMSQTFIEPKGKEDPNWAKGHTKEAEVFSPEPFYAGNLYAFGGLKSTVGDMLIFSKGLFGRELLEEKWAKKMTQYAQTNTGKPVYEAYYFPEGFTPPPMPDHLKKNGYGLGLSLMENRGKRVIWHSGGMPGFNAIWMYLPEADLRMVILSNTGNGIVPNFEDIMEVATRI